MAIPDFHHPHPTSKFALLVDVGYLYAAAGEVLLGAKERKEFRVRADELIKSLQKHAAERIPGGELLRVYWYDAARDRVPTVDQRVIAQLRSEEHTSELQSRENLVCRLLLEKKTRR